MSYAKTQSFGSVLEIILSMPERYNSIFMDSYESMNAALDEAAKPEIRSVLLRGEGKVFCIGGDLKAFADLANKGNGLSSSQIDLLHQIIEKIHLLQKPVIALVQGAATGAGLSLVLACDLVMAAENAKFNLAYTSVGLSPDGGATHFLPRHIGMKKAMEIFLMGKTMLAREALEFGLINRIEDPDCLLEKGRDLAQQLAQGPTAAYAKIKKMLTLTFQNSFVDQLQLESKLFSESTLTTDFKEGVNAYFGKKAPLFVGK